MKSERSIPSLDGLRAFSILLVLLGHSAWKFADAAAPLQPLSNVFVESAQIGVSVFFVISGYLITGLLLTELDRTGDVRLGRFYWRRAFRILPAFYTFLAVIGLLGVLQVIALDRGDLLRAGLFVWNYVPSPSRWDQSWWVGHSWSLSVEEQFYLLWPATLLMLGRRRATRLAIALILIVPVVRVASYFLFPSFRGRLGMMLHTRVDTLMFGCLLSLLSTTDIPRRAYAVVTRFRLQWISLGFLLVVSPLLAVRFHGAYTITVGQTVEGLAIASILVWGINATASPSVRLLNSRLLVHIGILSYSLYLWQQLFTADRIVTHIYARVPYAINIVAIFLCAEASYWMVERPFLRLRARLARQPATVVNEAPANGDLAGQAATG